jgi:hypothetical protein
MLDHLYATQWLWISSFLFSMKILVKDVFHFTKFSIEKVCEKIQNLFSTFLSWNGGQKCETKIIISVQQVLPTMC